jgi:CHASE3 domain sensor protein
MVRRPLSNRLRDAFDALSLRTRLVGGFAVLLVLVLLAGAVSVLSHQRVQDAFDAFLRGDNRIAEFADDARAALLRARRSEKD